jgi:BASS family bile acid:Na+ symporter
VALSELVMILPSGVPGCSYVKLLCVKPARASVYQFWKNFPLMVAMGLVVGLVVGGLPDPYATPVLELTLIISMTFALTEISFRGISPKAEARGVAISLIMSYVALGGLMLLYGSYSSDSEIRSGWILVAAVPPAIGVVPLTSYLRGDVRRSLISNAVLYLLGLVTVPALSLLFLGQAVPAGNLVIQTFLLIGVPIAVSRPLRRWNRIQDVRPAGVSVSFFFSVLIIAGSTRGALFSHPDLVTGLSILAFLRTYGLGLVIFGAAVAFRIPRNSRIAAMTFAGFKNVSLAVVLAFTFFGPLSSLPAIVSLIFEILWMSTLPLLFRTSKTRMLIR